MNRPRCSSWEGCPNTDADGEFITMPGIICAFSQAPFTTVVRKLIPYADENGEVVYIQKIAMGSTGVPDDDPLSAQSFVQASYLERVADLPFAASPSPETD